MNYFDQFHLYDHDEPDKTQTSLQRNQNLAPSPNATKHKQFITNKQYQQQRQSNNKLFDDSLGQGQTQKRQQRCSDKWNDNQRKLYFKFYLKTLVKQPYLEISWKRWKVNNIFSQMTEYIKTKSKDQIKSFDQRMKNYWFKKNKKDILQCLEAELKNYQDEDQQIFQLFTELENKKSNQSQHMIFLKLASRKIEQLSKQIQIMAVNWDLS